MFIMGIGFMSKPLQYIEQSQPTKGGENMRDLWGKGSVREWYNQTRFVYPPNFGRISELGSFMNKLYEIPNPAFKIFKGQIWRLKIWTKKNCMRTV